MTAKDVLFLIYGSLITNRVPRINDVTMERGVDGQSQIVLTTNDKENKQVWVLDAESILASGT